ncbi:condensation domain-containing protein [Streptomyces virginiae]|uniref:condensation domain-containing protein n=1 Tax=Streptomyces virginiae TaxID=1961 RepID=UPI0036802AF5
MTSDETKIGAVREGAGTHDIAIIGMAVRLPEADDIQQFLQNLRSGRDSVRELSAERRSRTSLSPDEAYQLNGYIEDIDSFDHAFFGISKGESQNMAPEHRLLLQVAYQAVENAGYAPASLHGRRASVYVGDTRIAYHELARTIQPTMVMGVHLSAMAGRISRFFGLRGPASMVDSSCSSGLLAVHQAVKDLVLGDAELALVCGVNLNLFGERKQDDDGLDLGIRSADGKTRTFSADADGTGSGEAVVAVVLKPLDQALCDGDIVHAVIKGIAANNVADRSSSLTAPDSTAQAEVIKQAWEKAGVDPTTISYIEAHGTATRLGDPIEIEAIDLAFSKVTTEKHFCALSSVKSNIGHTWSASGLVGLVKAVLALRHQELFPNLHAQSLSPLINFSDSVVSVTQELTPWEPSSGVRRAGVSSFGIMGTNVHAVLEEAPAREEIDNGEAPIGGYWIPISAKSPAALESNLAALRKWIKTRPELRLPDVQHSLLSSRNHYPHRYSVTAADLDELSRALAAASSGRSGSAKVVTVLLVSGRCHATPELTHAFRTANPQFDLMYSQCERAAAEAGGNPSVGQFAFQYALYGLLRHLGLSFRHVVGEGAGKHVIDAIASRIDLSEALRRAELDSATLPGDLDARVDRLLEELVGDQQVLFVEAGPLSTVSRALAERNGAGYEVVSATDGLAALLRDLYLGGANWNWEATTSEGRRIELPSYQFERVRCWLDEANLVEPTQTSAVQSSAVEPAAQVSAIDSVMEIWKDVLGLDEVAAEDSFFELGGDSISGIQVINRLQSIFNVELDVVAIFDYETPQDLAGHVEETVHATRALNLDAEPAHEPDASEPEEVPTTAEQLNMWLAAEFAGGSIAFNLTRSFELTGTVNTEALQRALNALAARHDALRATFSYTGEELTQHINPAAGFTVPLELLNDTAVCDTADTAALARAFASRRFDLRRGPLVRAQLASIGVHRHLLTLCTHHIVVDGWSLKLLVRDLGAYYASFDRGVALNLPEIGVDYSEHHRKLAQQVSGRYDDAAAYWLGKFRTPVPVLNLPAPPDEGLPSYSGTYQHYSLPVPLWQRLKLFCQATGVTVFTSMLSAITAALRRFSPDGDLVVGTLIAGRHSESLEQLVAMLIQTLPLRVQVDADSSFEQLSETVRATFVDALRNSDYPCEELVEELQQRGLLRASGLFDVMVAFQQFGQSKGASVDALAGPDLTVRPIEVNLDTRDVPINIMLAEEAGTLHSAIRYDTSRFEASMMDRLWADLTQVLDRALHDPSAPLDLIVDPIDGAGHTTEQAITMPAPDGEHASGTAYADLLTGIWREVLGVSDLTVTDRFFSIGGNSLRAIKVLARIQSQLGVTLDLGTFFARPTITGLADVLAEAQQPLAVTPIPSLGGPGDYEGACTQDLLMEIDRTSAHPGAFHRNDLHELHGPVDPTLMKQSFELLVERHESLRTTCDVVVGRTVQSVHAPGVLPLNYRFHDMTGRSAEEVHEFVIARKDEPFETASDPLVRADLMCIRENAYLLLTSFHHVLADGTSAMVLHRDWRELYEALVAGRVADLPELPIQYKDAAAWRNGRLTPEVRALHREFWRRELDELPIPVPVPADLPRPEVSTFDGARLHLPLPTDLAERFGALAQRHSVTEFTAAWCAVGLLFASTGVADSLLGTYSLGRNRQDLENQVGSFINTIPLRFRLAAGDDVPELLAQAHQTILRAFEHDEYPYGEIMRDLGWQRGPERSPLFDVVVNLDQMESAWEAPPAGATVSFVPKEIPRRAKQADLQFVFQRYADGLVLAMSYNTEIFSQGRAHAILQRLQVVLEGITAERSISEILSQGEFPNG